MDGSASALPAVARPHNGARSDVQNEFYYTGRRVDPETGLYYYRARYYSPKLGRFLQTDPVGTTDDSNSYAYTAADPINAIDSSGEAVEAIQDGNRITLNFYIRFQGAKTPANIRRFSHGIRKAFTNQFGKYNVTANVLVPTNQTPANLINTIFVREGSAQGEIYNDPATGKPTNTGWFGENMSAEDAGHEGGHLAYLKDPTERWLPGDVVREDPDIMDSSSKPALERTIDAILKEASEHGTLKVVTPNEQESTSIDCPGERIICR